MATNANESAGKRVILLVEDDEQVRHFARIALERLGYQVLEASDGQTAIGLCEQASHNVDLVLTDILMPEMSGSDLVGELRRRCTNLKAIYMSGYDERTLDESVLHEPGVRFIAKPFDIMELAGVVRSMLDEA